MESFSIKKCSTIFTFHISLSISMPLKVIKNHIFSVKSMKEEQNKIAKHYQNMEEHKRENGGCLKIMERFM